MVTSSWMSCCNHTAGSCVGGRCDVCLCSCVCHTSQINLQCGQPCTAVAGSKLHQPTMCLARRRQPASHADRRVHTLPHSLTCGCFTSAVSPLLQAHPAAAGGYCGKVGAAVSPTTLIRTLPSSQEDVQQQRRRESALLTVASLAAWRDPKPTCGSLLQAGVAAGLVLSKGLHAVGHQQL